MSWTPTEHTYDPKQQPSRFADTTENLHRMIAWFYGLIGALGLVVCVLMSSGGKVMLVLGLFVAAVVGLHAMLAAGARNRNEVAKFGSVIVGVLMLAGFPIGTIVGGMLIYNGVQHWPRKRDVVAGPAGPDMRL